MAEPLTPEPCLFFKQPEAFYCRIHADVRLALTDERCRTAAAVPLLRRGRRIRATSGTAPS